jgi:hypothetical protein
VILSPVFWEHVVEALKVLEPVYIFIRYVDSGRPDIGKIYEKWEDMGQKLLNSGTTNSAAAHRCFIARTTGTTRKIGLHHPAHTAAMLLHPHNWDISFPEKYPDSYGQLRNELVTILEKVAPTPLYAATALLQFDNEFKAKTLGSFQNPIIQVSAKGCMDPASWWECNACEIPQLQFVAKRVLSLGIANSAAERNWSVHAFLHSKNRNRLSFEKQRKLVNVYVNLKLREKLLKSKPAEYFSDSEFNEESDAEEPAVLEIGEAADNLVF